MDDNEARYVQLVEKQLDQERLARMDAQNNYSQVSGFSPNRDQNIIQARLDPKEILDRIYHLLSSHKLEVVDKKEKWVNPKDDRSKIFTDYGVEQIMNVLSFYINPYTILSNYDEVTIIWKMKDLGIELSDFIFNRCEHFFYYPTPEELFDKYWPIYNSNSFEQITEEELYNKCVQWSMQELQSKFRHFPIIVTAILDLVHSTYLRALNGKERESLSKIIHVNENTQTPMQQPKKRGGILGILRP